MGKKPLVSIIVPVYNKRPYLVECFDSITNQTWKDIEIIAVDDGSTDGSSGLLKEIAKSETRLSVITTENRGPSAARNTGLDIAVGEYVTFVDADDLIEADYIEQMVKSIGDADFCTSGCKMWDQRKNQWIEYRCIGKRFSREEYLEWLKSQDEYVVGIGWKLYRKAIIDKHHIRFNTLTNISEDTMFYFDVLLHFKSAVCIDDLGYIIRVHDLNSLTHQIVNEVEGIKIILKGYARVRNAATEEALQLIVLRQQIRTMIAFGKVCCYRIDGMNKRRKVFFAIADEFQIKITHKLDVPTSKQEALVRFTLKTRLFFPFYIAIKLFHCFKKEDRLAYERIGKQAE